MKTPSRIIVFLLLFAFSPWIHAQPVFFGLTEYGGNNAGAISRFDASTNSLTSVFSYPNDGISPSLQSAPIQLPNGKVYGMTNRGGKFNYGTIYSINEDGSGFQKLHDFNLAEGGDPRGSLFRASNGLLYGMTLIGGTSGQGGVFRFDPATATFSFLYSFTDAPGNRQGQRPFGSFAEHNGRLFGLLSSGGENNIGTIFSISLDGTGFTKHHDFVNTTLQLTGGNPYGSLFLAADGLFYGMTNTGGQFGGGVIFSFDPLTLAYQKRFDLGATSPVRIGASPFGSFIQDPVSGVLYGLTSLGGANNHGTVFQFNTGTNSLSVLYNLRNVSPGFDGRLPGGSLIQTADRSLIGLASTGGSQGRGTVFRLNPDGTGFTVLRQLAQADGQTPYGTPLLLSNGNIMVTPSQAGDGLNGTIAIISNNGTTYTKVHDFNLYDGAYPKGSLTEGKNKLLYGTTFGGGNFGQGTIFSYDPVTGNFVKLHNFQNVPTKLNGNNPQGNLTVLADGSLLGLALGGSGNQGLIYAIGADGSGYTKRHEFSTTDGALPLGSLVLASNGLVYGMTSRGGSSGQGVIFSFNPASSALTVIHEFTGTNGATPQGDLVQARNGLLYGMTPAGGANNQGVIFSLDPATGTVTVLHQFLYSASSTGAAKPLGSLVQAANGLLYGLGSEGGLFNEGAVFSLDPTNGLVQTLASFDNATALQGKTPKGSLVLGSDRKLYGMTSAGGTANLGTIFSVDPANGTLTKLADFNLDNGASPLFGNLVEPGRCRPPQVVCPGDQTVVTAANSCTASVTFSATLADYCPATIRYYLNYSSGTPTEIISGQSLAVGIHPITAVASNLLGEQSTCTFTITVRSGATEICGNLMDDDCDGLIDENCPPVLSIADTTTTESAGIAKVRVSLAGSTNRVVSTWYITQERTAKSPQDFFPAFGLVVFQPGEREKFIPVQIRRDNQQEGPEQFDLRLFGVVNASYQNNGTRTGKATVTILNGSGTLTSGTGFNSESSPMTTPENLAQARLLEVSAAPNPSSAAFKLRFAGGSRASIQVVVTDIQGRVVERRTVNPDQGTLVLGEAWPAGIYMMDIRQGTTRQVLRLVRQ